jgi:hypothetical protein
MESVELLSYFPRYFMHLFTYFGQCIIPTLPYTLHFFPSENKVEFFSILRGGFLHVKLIKIRMLLTFEGA